MPKKQPTTYFIFMILLVNFSVLIGCDSEEEIHKGNSHGDRTTQIDVINTDLVMERFMFDSGLAFEYPDAVRGIYVTGPSAGGSRFEELLQLIETTDLNTMVIDIKEDHGKLTLKPEKG